jgi:uncharacterized SAM-binding protein YcdF (DUF218 family)
MSGAVSRRLLIVAAVMVGLALAWTVSAGSLLVATDDVGETGVVLALSGDPLGDRVHRAIDLAVEADAERIVFFLDAGPRPESPAEIRRIAIDAGIHPDAIRFIGPVDSTAMEAGLAAGLVDRCHWQDLAVVTSPYHTRRAGWTFDRAVGDAATVQVVPSLEEWDEVGWWRSQEGGRAVFREWAKGLGALWFVVRPPQPIRSSTPC